MYGRIRKEFLCTGTGLYFPVAENAIPRKVNVPSCIFEPHRHLTWKVHLHLVKSFKNFGSHFRLLSNVVQEEHVIKVRKKNMRILSIHYFVIHVITHFRLLQNRKHVKKMCDKI